jgi:hypothetical protein
MPKGTVFELLASVRTPSERFRTPDECFRTPGGDERFLTPGECFRTPRGDLVAISGSNMISKQNTPNRNLKAQS